MGGSKCDRDARQKESKNDVQAGQACAGLSGACRSAVCPSSGPPQPDPIGTGRT